MMIEGLESTIILIVPSLALIGYFLWVLFTDRLAEYRRASGRARILA